MKLLVTGASGFLGRAVVRRAAEEGHAVLALVRPTADTGALGWPDSVTILRGDLRQRGDWRDSLGDLDAVIHLAAAPSGDLAYQFAGTVVATENLLDSLPMQSLRRFVHISSFSVYDFERPGTGGTITEGTSIEAAPESRDAYTITKMEQERIVAEACETAGTPLVILRPGAIYGPGKDWDFGRALKVGRFDLIFAPGAAFRLTYVDNCADAIVRALDAPVASGTILNIVDDSPPTHGQYYRMCRRAGARTGIPLYIPWLLVSGMGLGVQLVNQIFFKGRAKVPEFMSFKRQKARWRPFRYSNKAARDALGWRPSVSLDSAIVRTLEDRTPPQIGSGNPK